MGLKIVANGDKNGIMTSYYNPNIPITFNLFLMLFCENYGKICHVSYFVNNIDGIGGYLNGICTANRRFD